MKEFNLKLNEQQMQVVLNGLAELPYKNSAGVVQVIANQLMEQSKPVVETKAPE